LNKIQLENNLSGTLEWQLDNPALNREIEGYASQTSINQGESIFLFVNTVSDSYSIEIYRMGWYDGLGGKLVNTISNVKGTNQPTPLPDPDFGLVECNWNNPIEIIAKADWTTGIYVAKLEENNTDKQSYCIFVIRDDAAEHDILFQLPVTTYQAYNYWGGKSLYDWGSGSDTYWGTVSGKRASKVSFNRPYARSNNKKAAHGMGAGEFFTNIQPVTTHFFPISSASWDYNMVRWLEQNGYNIGYITNIDTHNNAKLLNRAKIFMSHGHDEYWSFEMRSNIEKTLADGVNLTFFSSNTMFWQIRFETSEVTLDSNRTMVCYKDRSDPISDKMCTVNFRDSPIENPESKIIGVQHFMDPVDGDMVICKEKHWVFENTGLKNGNAIEGVLGYEIDHATQSSPKNIDLLTNSPGKNLLEDNYSYILKQVVQKINRKLNRLIKNNSNLKYGVLILGILVFCAFCFWFISTFRITGFVILGLISLISAIFIYGYLTKLLKRHNRLLSRVGNSNMSLYVSQSGAKVFSTGSMQWSWGLDDYNVPELRVSRRHENVSIITRNILSRFLNT